MTKEPLLSLKNVSKEIILPDQTLKLLHGINLDLSSGTTHAIMGRSGSGKSTLLALMAGLDIPTHGECALLGTSWASLSMDARARYRGEHVGIVFQDFQLIHSMTALENVLLPLDIMGIRNSEAQAKALLMELGLGERLHHRPSMLSGGEQQRVAIARAYATSPRCILLDEPTGQLDEATGLQILDRLFALQRHHQTTLVFVTHDTYVAERCDHQYLLKEGHLHARTSPL